MAVPSHLSNWLVLHKGNWVNIIGHFWSLALEEQFYFVWPWILLLIKPKRLPWILGFSETALIAVRSWWVFQHGPSHAWGLTRIDGLLCGASAASIVRTIRFSPAMKSALPFLSMGLFAGFLAITRVHPESLAWALEDTLGYPLLALTFTLLLLAATSTDGEGGWLQWLLCRRVLTRTGKYAYGLYVFHLPLVFFIGRWTSELLPTRYDLPLYWDLRIFVGIALSYVIAILSYNYFEKPFLKLKDRFRPTAPAPRANKAIPATLTMTNAMRRE